MPPTISTFDRENPVITRLSRYAAFLVVLGLLVAVYQDGRQAHQEARDARVGQDTALHRTDAILAQEKANEDQLRQTRDEVASVRSVADALTAQIETLGVTPVATVPAPRTSTPPSTPRSTPAPSPAPEPTPAPAPSPPTPPPPTTPPPPACPGVQTPVGCLIL